MFYSFAARLVAKLARVVEVEACACTPNRALGSGSRVTVQLPSAAIFVSKVSSTGLNVVRVSARLGASSRSLAKHWIS